MSNEQATAPSRIFRYFNGESFVFGDPLDLNRRVWFQIGNPAKLTATINAVLPRLNEATDEEVKEASTAQQHLADAIRTAFELKPFDRATGKGITDEACFSVWDKFCQFLKS